MEINVDSNNTQPTNRPAQSGKWKLFLVLAICAAPLAFAYLTYYVIKPTARTNYGTLLDPRQYPIPKLNSVLQGGGPTELSAYQGKWIMLQVSASDCQKQCQDGLFAMRQLRLMQGKDMDRIERVMLVPDQLPIDTILIRSTDGMHILRVDPKVLDSWLPTESGTTNQDRLYLIDPLGNLIMRYPVGADPYKVKTDIVKLLKASSIG
jgi:cytochrome oxidase Cu insertion factor (SCO1/SenC/PrrC family)